MLSGGYYIMKLTVSKSKNSASFYVQKSIRKPDGSVTTITVEKLGNLDEVKTKAQGLPGSSRRTIGSFTTAAICSCSPSIIHLASGRSALRSEKSTDLSMI